MSDTTGAAGAKPTSSSTFFVFVLGLVLGLVVGALAGAFLPARLSGENNVKLGGTPDPNAPKSPTTGSRDDRPAPKTIETPKADAPKTDLPKVDPKADPKATPSPAPTTPAPGTTPAPTTPATTKQ